MHLAGTPHDDTAAESDFALEFCVGAIHPRVVPRRARQREEVDHPSSASQVSTRSHASIQPMSVARTSGRQPRAAASRSRILTTSSLEGATGHVDRAWRNRSESGGVRTIQAVLTGGVAWNLVRRRLAVIKRLHRARRRAEETAHRLSVEVRRRDVMCSMDGTHLARLEDGEPVEGQVVCETSSPKTFAVEVGVPAQIRAKPS
jgi:hypothetical protein